MTLRRRIAPIMAHEKIPVLTPDSGTEREPMKQLMDRAGEMEQEEGTLMVSLFDSQAEAGMLAVGRGVVVVAADESAQPRAKATELRDLWWDGGGGPLPGLGVARGHHALQIVAEAVRRLPQGRPVDGLPLAVLDQRVGPRPGSGLYFPGLQAGPSWATDRAANWGPFTCVGEADTWHSKDRRQS